MIELKKMYISITENTCNLNAYQIIKISLVLYNAHIIFKNQNKVICYINNYIDQDQFNELYNLNQVEKNIRNVDAISRKLKLALIKATN